ncbi:MAG TPA: hypothetical protein VK841_19720 [Polyangiaceae bacterium]|nr:hypothetical protein [Polyangiaceae bacterium]
MDDFPQDRRLVLTAGRRRPLPFRRSRIASAVRGVALAARAVAWAGLAACSAQAMSNVGFSAPRAPEAVAEAVDAGPPPAPPVAPDFRSHMTRLSDRFLSRGHAERFDAVIWGNTPMALEASADADFPEGAVLVEEAVVRDTRGDRPFGLLVMTKEKDSFRFDAVDADGRVEPADRAAACVTCHREAAHFVFPWRRPESP